MYYVKRGNNNFFVARGPKYKEDARMGIVLGLGLLYYDYDDLDHWNDVYLAKEARIVADENNEEYDPAAFAAVRGEIQRRAGIEASPWFDNLDDLIAELNKVMEENTYDYRKPIITPNQVDPVSRGLIRDLAKLEKERWEGKKPSMDPILVLQSRIMDSSFSLRIRDCFDYVEDRKMVAAHLLFLYAQERQMAEQEGREPNEDFFMAGSSLYNIAAIEQALEDE